MERPGLAARSYELIYFDKGLEFLVNPPFYFVMSHYNERYSVRGGGV